MERWGERLKNASNEVELRRLELVWRKAPIGAAKKVVQAELVIAVFDEPATGEVTELDGESAHDVRIVLVDLSCGKPLLRLRRRVDPGWITPNLRSRYARELDGCKFAMAVRDAVRDAHADPDHPEAGQ